MSLGESLSRRATIGRFVVEELSVLGRAAPLGYSPHGHQPFVGTHPDPQFIADLQLFGGFRARPVDLHLAAGDSRHRQRACFEKPRGPEPAIEAYG